MNASGKRDFRPVLGLLALIVLLRAALALRLQLLGDEAFYWQAGRQLALAYSDIPFVTALLTKLGSGLLPGEYLGVRLMFLLLGLLTPLLIYRLAREIGVGRPWLAAGASLCMPLLALNGVLALPEVPLLFAALMFILGGVRLIQSDGGRGWLLAGLGAALGLATHYRFAVVIIAAGVFVLGSRDGRALLRHSRVWIGIAIAAIGLIPIVWFNLGHEFGGLRFQFVDRHPWSFQLEGLVQPLVQFLVVTPPLFVVLMVSLVHALKRARRGDAVAGFLASMAVVPLLIFFLAGLWADLERTSFHWPLVAYLPLLALLPDVLDAWRGRRWYRGVLVSIPVVGLSGAAVLFAWLLTATLPAFLERHSTAKWFPANFTGWQAAADRTRYWLTETGSDRVMARASASPGAARDGGVLEGTQARFAAAGGDGALLADNFMLAAELDFELQDRSVDFVLDNSLNRKHGRALQLAIWQRDEAALRAAMPVTGLLVVEATAVEFQDRPAWLRRICKLFPGVEVLDELVLYHGRKRFLFLRVHSDGKHCQLPSFAYLDEPFAGDELEGEVVVSGWAFNDGGGIENVELLVDGEVVGELEYGAAYPGVLGVFPGSTDPNHPDVGFSGRWDASALPAGPHELAIRVIAADGAGRVTEHRVIHITGQ